MGIKNRRKIRFVAIFFFFLIPIFLWPKNGKAADRCFFINEIYNNVAVDKGKDPNDEWVELYNSCSKEIDLKDWRIADNSTKRLISGSTLIVAPSGFALLSKTLDSWSSFGLNPGAPNSRIIFIELGSRIGNGLGNSGDRLILINPAGEIEDAVSWGNDRTYSIYPSPKKGSSLERDQAASEKLFVANSFPTPGQTKERIDYPSGVILSEALPAPAEGASSEFIELYNKNPEAVDLSGWSVDDRSGGSEPYTILKGTIIEAGQFFLIYKSQSRLSLNDDGDEIRLIDPNGEVKSMIMYDKSHRGQSIALSEDLYQWTEVATPGQTNIISIKLNTAAAVQPDEKPIEMAIASISNDSLGRYIKVAGKVSRTEGDTFFLEDNGAAIKIRIQEKSGIDKPRMRKGNLVSVAGLLNLYRNELRILPFKQDDVKIINSVEIKTAETLPETGLNELVPLYLSVVLWNLLQKAKRKLTPLLQRSPAV